MQSHINILLSMPLKNRRKIVYKNCPKLKFTVHYLMGLGPNLKEIPQNSEIQIRIPEVM